MKCHRIRRALAVLALMTPLTGAAIAAAPAHASVPVPGRVRAFRWAVTQKGKPYIWGGTGPYGYDCSGLVQAAYRRIGINLPRTTYAMLADSRQLIRIPQRDAREGDLAFFGSGHVELVEYAWKYHWTFGALEPGTRLGFHRFNWWWHPTEYFRVRGAG